MNSNGAFTSDPIHVFDILLNQSVNFVVIN